MKMYKRFFVVILGILFTLSGCFAREKEFSKVGVTIQLTDAFVEKEIIQVPFYLESADHIFMANPESKQNLPFVMTLEEYINAVLDVGNITAEVKSYEEEEQVKFYYAYYDATVEFQEFGYMLVVMEGEKHYYSMNFGCLKKNLEDNKEQYLDWAKTITVE